MADISKITLPSGSSYDIKDAAARNDISLLKTTLQGGSSFLGVTTTQMSDGKTGNTVTVNGQSTEAKNGDIVLYGSKEFLYQTSDNKWHELGDLTGIKDLAYTGVQELEVDGSVSKPTITVTPATTTIKEVKTTGTLPELGMTVSNEILTITFNQGALTTTQDATVVNGISSATSSDLTFTGSISKTTT